MSRRATLICLLLLSSFLASGWGTVLAAAFCQHQAAGETLAADEHECCHAQLKERLEPAEGHCGAEASEPSMHEAMASAEAVEDRAAAPSSADEAEAAAVAIVNQQAGACLHCVGRLGPQSFVVVRAPEQKKQDDGHAVPLTTPVFEARSFSFARPLSFASHAPPGANIARHLSFCVLLI